MRFNPLDDEAALLLSTIYYDEDKTDEAIVMLKKVLDRDPYQVMANYYLAKTYRKIENYDEAIEYYKRTVEIRPYFETALTELGIIYEFKGMDDEAIELYEKILYFHTYNTAIIDKLAQIYVRKQNYDKALENYLKLGRHAIGDTNVKLKIALIYYKMKDYANAKGELNKLITLQKANYEAVYYLGIITEEEKLLDDALDIFDEIPDSSSFYIDAQIRKAIIFERQKNLDKSVKLIKGLIAETPDQRERLYGILSTLYENAKEYGNSIDALKTLLKDDDKNIYYLFRIGVLYDKLGDVDKSLEKMHKVLFYDPENANALNYIGYTYADQGIKLNLAEDYINKALKLKPGDGYITDSLGWLYFKKGKLKEAAIKLEEAVELAPDDPVIIEHLGDVYYGLNEKDKALEQYERSLIKSEDQNKELENKIEKIKREL